MSAKSKTPAKKASAKKTPSPKKALQSKKASPKAKSAGKSKTQSVTKAAPSKKASKPASKAKAPVKKVSKAKATKPAPKAKPAQKVKPKSGVKAIAKKPQTKPTVTKATKAIVKKSSTKTAPLKKVAKPAKKITPQKKAKPEKKAVPAPKAAPTASRKATSSKAVVEAPPAPKRPGKITIAPPQTLGKMGRRRVDDEPDIIIEPVKGPVKMTGFLIKQKQKLTQLREAYMNSIEGVANETIRQRPEDAVSSAFGMHQADAGSDAYDRDFALSLLGKEQDALYEINEALKRIETGVYGICEMSGHKIPHERLEALPFTRYTVACQEGIERQQMGGRWSRPVRSLFGLDDASETSADASDDEESDSLDNSRD